MGQFPPFFIGIGFGTPPGVCSIIGPGWIGVGAVSIGVPPGPTGGTYPPSYPPVYPVLYPLYPVVHDRGGHPAVGVAGRAVVGRAAAVHRAGVDRADGYEAAVDRADRRGRERLNRAGRAGTHRAAARRAAAHRGRYLERRGAAPDGPGVRVVGAEPLNPPPGAVLQPATAGRQLGDRDQPENEYAVTHANLHFMCAARARNGRPGPHAFHCRRSQSCAAGRGVQTRGGCFAGRSGGAAPR